MAIVFFTTSYRVMVASMIIIGMTTTIRQQVCIIYLYESFRKEHYARVLAFIVSIDGIVGIIGALYFLFVSKNWLYLYSVAFIMQLLGTVGCLSFHESPKYLIVTN